MKKRTIFIFSILTFFLLFPGCSASVRNQADFQEAAMGMKYPSASDFYAELLADYYSAEDDTHYYRVTGEGILSERKIDGSLQLLVPIKSADAVIRNLFVFDNLLYYFMLCSGDDYPHNYFEAWCVDAEGNQTKLFNNIDFAQQDEYLHSCKLFDGKLYLQMNYRLYCYDIAAETLQMVVEDAGAYEVIGNTLYFIDRSNRTFTIYQMNLDTKEKEIVLGDGKWNPDKTAAKEYYRSFTFIKETLYYVRDPGGIYRYDESGDTLVYGDPDISPASLFTYSGKLYFITDHCNSARLMEYDPVSDSIKHILDCENYGGIPPQIKRGCFYYQDLNWNVRRIKLQENIA